MYLVSFFHPETYILTGEHYKTLMEAIIRCKEMHLQGATGLNIVTPAMEQIDWEVIKNLK